MIVAALEEKLDFPSLDDVLSIQDLKRSHDVMTQINCSSCISVLNTNVSTEIGVRMGQQQRNTCFVLAS